VSRKAVGDLPGARKAPRPDRLRPMLASLTEGPFSKPDWAFELKLDGIRALAVIGDSKVKLISRRGHDITGQYPLLAGELGRQPLTNAVLDGEIVALDDKERPSFQLLQQRLNLTREEDIRKAENEVPVHYYLFDVLYLDGYDLTGVALRQRKELLKQAVQPSARVRLLDYFAGDGVTVYREALDKGFEGVIAKHLDSIYEMGKRSRQWLKVKSTRTDEFVIAGYTQGKGSRSHAFGALLLGYFRDGDELAYAGHVGTGFDERTLDELNRKLSRLKTDRCPFAQKPPVNAPAVWVKPELVAEVKFSEWTRDGYLRAPVFLRLRPDKPASEARPAMPVSPPQENPSKRDKSENTVAEVMGQLTNSHDSLTIEVEGNKLNLTHLNKELWPAGKELKKAVTKRDFLAYLARVSPYLLPHLRDRPLTLSRYPHGIGGEHFFQKHLDSPVPDFVRRVTLTSEHVGGRQEYLICDNLSSLLWLGQLANLELHTWFSRITGGDDISKQTEDPDRLASYPDFIIFDIDPYIYSGREAKGDEPALNREGFARASEAALWLKEALDTLSLKGYIKTSGMTGLHIYVPVRRQFDYRAIRSAAQTVCHYVLRAHRKAITLEWTVEKRTGKVFLDYNQNVRGKTLACPYSPRPSPAATVSAPLRWEEVGSIYPTDFTIWTVPGRLDKLGDLWHDIFQAGRDLGSLLQIGESSSAP